MRENLPPFPFPFVVPEKKCLWQNPPLFFESSAVQESDDDSPRISSSSSPSSSSPLWFPSPLFSLTTHRPFLAPGHSRGWRRRRRRRTFYYSFSGDIFIRRRGGRTFPPASSCAAPFGLCPCRSLSSTCPVRTRSETAEKTKMPPPRFAPFLPPLPLNIPREKIPQFVQRENLFVAVFFSCRAAFTVHFTVLSCPVAMGPFSWETSPLFFSFSLSLSASVFFPRHL